MDWNFNPLTGVLSGSSFESQVKAKLAQASVAAFPSSSPQTIPTSGATTSGTSLTKTFTAPSAGYCGIMSDAVARVTNTSCGLTSTSLPNVGGDGAGFVPVSAGQQVQFWWKSGETPNLIFVPAVASV